MAKTKINLKAKVTQPRRPNLPKALTGIEGLDNHRETVLSIPSGLMYSVQRRILASVTFKNISTVNLSNLPITSSKVRSLNLFPIQGFHMTT